MEHALNLRIWEADLCEFSASLVYIESSRTARVTQKNPVSQKAKEKQLGALLECVCLCPQSLEEGIRSSGTGMTVL